MAVVGESASTVHGWRDIPFEACIKPARGRRGTVPQSEYRPNGRFPVVDQGAGLIAGYTDDESLVNSDDLPLVVFGDHTRNLKFVDFPFVAGADGTKLFAGNAEVDTRFLYFALRALRIPARGYNRHFRFLRESLLSVPRDKREQRAIAGVLSKIQRAVELEEKRIAALKELKAATMAKVFREGLRGERLKMTEIGEVPESWEVVRLSEIVSITSGQVDPKRHPYNSWIHIGPEDVEEATGRLLQPKTAGELSLISGKYAFEKRDIIYSKIRPYLRKVIIAPFAGLCSADMYPLKPRPGFNAGYMYAYLLSDLFTSQAVSEQARTGIPKVNRDQLGRCLVPCPSPEEQEEVWTLIKAIEDRFMLCMKQKSQLSEMFHSALHQLMTGRLRVHPEQCEVSHD